MCGICGVITSGPDRERAEAAVRAMTGALKHRGPDGSGIDSVETPAFSATLGHTRLSILDLHETASQPMRSGSDVIVFNGEIYNFQALARELRGEDAGLRSSGDTEVLLKLVSAKKALALPKLRGMFSFAQFVAEEQCLYLARDEFGIKPLFYFHQPERGLLVFASEVRALLASGLVPRRVSIAGLRSLLAFGSPVPPATIVRDVYAAPAGTWTKISDPRRPLEFHPYVPSTEDWVHAAPHADDATATERFLEELRESVKAHLVSDARLGCFLSGGVDSSAIALLSSGALPAGQPLETFCLSIGEDPLDESAVAGESAALLRARHTTVRVDAAALGRDFPEVLRALDQPSFDGANVYFISRESSRLGLRVMLSGLGGDEALGGYSFCRPRAADRISEQLLNRLPVFSSRGRLPSSLHSWNFRAQRMLDKMHAEPGLSRWLLRTQWIPAGARASLLRESAWEAEGKGVVPDWLRSTLATLPNGDEALNGKLKALSLTRMSMTFLADADAMAMASSQEIRVPFVDRRVFRSAFQIRSNQKSATPGKAPLRNLLRAGGLSGPAADHNKLGFHLPLEKWLRQPGGLPSGSGHDMLESLEQSDLFSPAASLTVQHYRAGQLDLPWAVPYLLLVAADYCNRHGLKV